MKFKLFLSIGIIFLLSSAIALAALDLKFVTAISQSPDPASEGNVVTFAVSFKTFGGVVANLKITGGIDGAQIFERTYAAIATDKLRTDSFIWTATAGNHTVWFELDPAQTAGDTNYGNNKIEKSFAIKQIIPVGKPNLTVSASYTPASVVNGAGITFTAIVANIGNADSAPCKLGFYVFGGQQKEFDIPALSPGQKKNVAHNWTAECNPPCNAYVQFLADSTDIVVESAENDNLWLKTDICECAGQNGTNLTITAVSPTAKFKQGDTVQYDITVSNKGNLPSIDTKMTFYEFMVLKNTFDVPPIDGGDSKVFTFSFMATCKKGQLIDVFIDPNNLVFETNETDNHFTKTFQCGIPFVANPRIVGPISLNTDLMNQLKLPNLKIEDNSWAYTCTGGGKFGVEFNVINAGKGQAVVSHVKVTLKLNSTIVFSKTIGVIALDPSEKQQYEFGPPALLQGGKTYTFIIEVDSNGEVTEINEGDNKTTYQIMCE